MERKWRVASSKTVLRDRWIDVRADRCFTPSGKEISPYYVLSYPDWVNVVAVTSDDRLVLTRQYRHGVADFPNELPSGRVDASDADPEVTARRELEEETGYVTVRWRKAAVHSPNPATHTNHVHVYVAEDVKPGGVQALDAGEEGLTVRLVPISTVLNSLDSGFLMQSMHIASLILGLQAVGRLKLTP